MRLANHTVLVTAAGQGIGHASVMAMAAVEMAMWDAKGKHLGQPLWKLWGGAYRRKVEVSAYLFGTDQQKLAASAQNFLDQGYRSFKVKI